MNYTPKQLAIMRAIARFRSERGMSPTLGEMASELKVSTVTVFEHIQSLERKGALKRGEKGTQRSIEILDAAFLPTSTEPLYRAALEWLSKLTGTETHALDARIRANLSTQPSPAPTAA